MLVARKIKRDVTNVSRETFCFLEGFMSVILTWIITHLLTELEAIVVADEPEIIAKMEGLVKKLEAWIDAKSPVSAAIVNPVMDGVDPLIEQEVPALVEKAAEEIKFM